MRIFHIATVSDWDHACSRGSYTTSTHGRTLAEEGFIHASRGDQWQAVRERWYSDVADPLVLLVIDPDLLTSPVLDEPVPGTTETFPHVYGPIDVDAVVQTIPLSQTPTRVPVQPVQPVQHVETGTSAEPGPSFSRLYFEEMFRNLLMASLVLALVVVAALGGLAVHDDWGPVTGALLGLVVGIIVVRRLFRRTST